MFRIARAPIVLERLVRAVRDPAAGALVLFLGTTRNRNAGRRVVRLEYEAYGRMAVAEMRRLAAEAKRRWPIRKVAMAHRIGPVPIGQASVAIVVSAGHRAPAVAARRWLIHRLKASVPSSKGEHFPGGHGWGRPPAAAAPPAARPAPP